MTAADEASGVSPGPPRFSLSDVGIKGKVVYKNFSHFEDPAGDGHFRNEGILQLEGQRKLTRWSRVWLVAEGRADDAGFVSGVHMRFPDTDTHRSAITAKEAVLRIDLPRATLAVGKQIYAWGTADIYNPTDVLNPYDYLDPIDHEKLGIWSASVSGTLAGVSLQLVVVPMFTPSRTPFLDGRWIRGIVDGRLPTAAELAFALEQLPIGAQVLGRDLPATSWDSIQYAARVKTTVAGWDVSASYYDGFENTPAVKRVDREGLIFQPVYSRITMAGVDFSTTWRKFEFHAEAAAKFIVSNGKDDRLQGIAGLNYTWDELPVRWLEQIQLSLEYARQHVLSSRRHSDIVLATGFTNAFRDAVNERIEFKFNENTQFAVVASIDVADKVGYLVQPKLTHKFTDNLHINLGFDIFGGPITTFWGKWGRSDRFFAFVTYLL